MPQDERNTDNRLMTFNEAMRVLRNVNRSTGSAKVDSPVSDAFRTLARGAKDAAMDDAVRAMYRKKGVA